MGRKINLFATTSLLIPLLAAAVSTVRPQSRPGNRPAQAAATPSPTNAPAGTNAGALAANVNNPPGDPPASPTSPATGQAPKFEQSIVGNWIAFSATLIAALIAAVVGVFSLRRQKELQKRNEELQKELQERTQTFEREKIELQRRSNVQQVEEAAQLQRQLDKASTEEAEAERLRTAEEMSEGYRRKLITSMRNLKILDMTRPLNLENLYVHVRVREDDPPRYGQEEDFVKMAAGEPTELLRLSQARLAERATKAMSPEEALGKFRLIAVLGDPGAGKTTMVRYLALKMAQNALPNLPHLPIYIELQAFANSGIGNLLDFAAAMCESDYGFQGARAYMERQLEDGKAAILLDGLDEVLGGASAEEAQGAYDHVLKEAKRLNSRFPEAPIVVTCRRAGWRGGLAAFQTLEVLDMDWGQIQQFMRNWFRDDRAKAEGLQRELAANLRMQTLAANPLILSLICIVYDRELELPERRAELYNRCVAVLLREWDSHRMIKRFAQFTTDRKSDLLKEVAWHFHTTGRRYFPEPELLHVVADFLPTINIPAQENKSILDEIAAQYGLLKVQAHGWYGFLHLTLQEYFTALSANERGATGLQEVVSHRFDSWWEEVVFLLAGRMIDATALLLGILGRPVPDRLPAHVNDLVPEGEPLAAGDDIFHSDTLLAARCLTGTPRVQMGGLRERILSDVKRILFDSPVRLNRDRAARVLVEVGDDKVTAELMEMLRKRDAAERVRPSIIAAFGELGDEEVAEQLLSILDSQLEGPGPEVEIMEALANLKAPQASGRLLKALRDSLDDYGRYNNILDALAKLDDKTVAPQLMQLFDDVRQRNFSSERVSDPSGLMRGILTTVGKLGDKSVSRRVLDVLLDEDTNPPLIMSASAALKDLADDSLLEPILEQLRSDKLSWEIKWLLTVALEGLAKSAREPLARMLSDSSIEERTRIGIATTLGFFGEKGVAPTLRHAIEQERIPASWSLPGYVWTAQIWDRIIRALRVLGDSTVLPFLLRSIDDLLPDTDEARYSLSEAETLVYAASLYNSEALSERVFSLIKNEAGEKEAARLPYFYTNMLMVSTTKFYIKDALEFLNRSPRQARPWTIIHICDKAADQADDVQTLKELLKLSQSRQANEEENASPARSAEINIYRAILNVSRRARVRVLPGGKLQPLPT